MNKLKELRKAKGVTQKEVAEYLGVTSVAYGHYETERRALTPDKLSKLANYFGVTIDDILGRENEQPASPSFGRPIEIEYTPVPEAEILIPVVASLRCGFGTPGEPYVIVGRKPVPASMVEKWGKEIVLNEAVGNSMSPTIRPRDFMVCYPGDWWDDGMVVVVNVNDSDTVKRIYRAKDGGIDLVPDNPEYKSMHYTPEDITEQHIAVLAHVLTTIPPEIQPRPRRDQ